MATANTAPSQTQASFLSSHRRRIVANRNIWLEKFGDKDRKRLSWHNHCQEKRTDQEWKDLLASDDNSWRTQEERRAKSRIDRATTQKPRETNAEWKDRRDGGDVRKLEIEWEAHQQMMEDSKCYWDDQNGEVHMEREARYFVIDSEDGSSEPEGVIISGNMSFENEDGNERGEDEGAREDENEGLNDGGSGGDTKANA